MIRPQMTRSLSIQYYSTLAQLRRRSMIRLGENCSIIPSGVLAEIVVSPKRQLSVNQFGMTIGSSWEQRGMFGIRVYDQGPNERHGDRLPQTAMKCIARCFPSREYCEHNAGHSQLNQTSGLQDHGNGQSMLASLGAACDHSLKTDRRWPGQIRSDCLPPCQLPASHKHSP